MHDELDDDPPVKLENENENPQNMNPISTVDSSMFQYLVFALHQIEHEHQILHQKIGAILAYIRQWFSTILCFFNTNKPFMLR